MLRIIVIIHLSKENNTKRKKTREAICWWVKSCQDVTDIYAKKEVGNKRLANSPVCFSGWYSRGCVGKDLVLTT